MKQYDLNNWDEFRPLIKDIRSQYGYLKLTEDVSKKNIVLFRGHENATWSLRTTLDRFSARTYSVADYVTYLLRCRNELETYTGRKWDVPQLPDVLKDIDASDDSWRPRMPYYLYEHLVYLRHHGFPSPLLDWTTSPYIAAYFAYCEKIAADRVAVYVYVERPRGVKGGMGGQPRITVVGPYITTDRRHFAQKAWYTIATKYDYGKKAHMFCEHGAIFSKEDEDQDVLVKITMPSSDRIRALEELNDYNINHYTLFETEDSLVKSLAIKVFEIDNL